MSVTCTVRGFRLAPQELKKKKKSKTKQAPELCVQSRLCLAGAVWAPAAVRKSWQRAGKCRRNSQTRQRRCNKPYFLPFLTLFAAQSISVAAQLNHNTPDSRDAAWDPPAAAPCGSNPSHSIPGTARGLWPMPGLGFPQDELSLLVFSSQDVFPNVSLALPTSNHCSGVITVHS